MKNSKLSENQPLFNKSHQSYLEKKEWKVTNFIKIREKRYSQYSERFDTDINPSQMRKKKKSNISANNSTHSTLTYNIYINIKIHGAKYKKKKKEGAVLRHDTSQHGCLRNEVVLGKGPRAYTGFI